MVADGRGASTYFFGAAGAGSRCSRRSRGSAAGLDSRLGSAFGASLRGVSLRAGSRFSVGRSVRGGSALGFAGVEGFDAGGGDFAVFDRPGGGEAYSVAGGFGPLGGGSCCGGMAAGGALRTRGAGSAGIDGGGFADVRGGGLVGVIAGGGGLAEIFPLCAAGDCAGGALDNEGV